MKEPGACKERQKLFAVYTTGRRKITFFLSAQLNFETDVSTDSKLNKQTNPTVCIKNLEFMEIHLDAFCIFKFCTFYHIYSRDICGISPEKEKL